MKRFFLCFTCIFLSLSLQAEEEELFQLGGKIHFYNGIDSVHSNPITGDGEYVRYVSPNLQAMATLKTKFSEAVSFESSLTSAQSQSCDNHRFLRTAALQLNFHPLFSLSAGCMKLEQGGWRDRKATSFSAFETALDHSVLEKKYGKALNLDLHFLGTFRLQLASDLHFSNNHENQFRLNTAWLMELYGTQPIFQVGFYNGFRSFHYALGIKGNVAKFFFRADFSRDHNVQEGFDTRITQMESAYLIFKAFQYFNPYARYVRKSTKAGDKLLTNRLSHLQDELWLSQGQTISAGTQMEFSSQIKAYVATNIKFGKFDEDEKLKWNVRLGVKGKI